MSSRRTRPHLICLTALVSAGSIVMAPGHALAAPAHLVSTSGDTAWVNAHVSNACPGSPIHGGEATGGPEGHETWCFEGGPEDSTSSGGAGWTFHSFDARTLRDDNDSLYWHADTSQAISGTSMWCGGTSDRTGSWTGTGGGYGNYWQQIMQLSLPGPFNATNGCSVQFKTRYGLECRYDYAYLEYYSPRRNQWRVVDRFNGKSGCTTPIPEGTCQGDWNNYNTATFCPGTPYGAGVSYPAAFRGGVLPRDFPAYPYVATGNAWVLIRGDSISSTPSSLPEFRLRWRFASDAHTSTEDGTASVRGFWLDDVKVRIGTFTHSENFDGLAVGALPGAPYSFPHLDPIYDGWAIRYDIDPPNEGLLAPEPGDDGFPASCWANASWQWSLVAEPGPIPPPTPGLYLPGYRCFLTSPAIPLDYADEEGGPFAHPGVTVQYDFYDDHDGLTCDHNYVRARTHRTNGIGPWSATGAWGPWRDMTDFLCFDCQPIYAKDASALLSLLPITVGDDSVQIAWVSEDSGAPGGGCWDSSLPPHLSTQYVVDNVSIGIFDAGAPRVSAPIESQGRFQDTFNIHSCLHTAMVANSDLGSGRYLLHDGGESLNVQITDPDGLTPGNVLLHYSYNGTGSPAPGSPVAMHLSIPDLFDPSRGGTWRATICDTPWMPGTEVRYSISIRDNAGNTAYHPAGAGPGASPDDWLSVRILPTPGAKYLLVDDSDERAPYYHPCRLDTAEQDVSEFYASVLRDLGYGFMQPGGFDVYRVNAPGGLQRTNEPWGFWTGTPAAPDSGEIVYDAVIWTTGRRSHGTIQDTTQTFLKQFVFHGGCALITGDAIGYDVTQPGTPEDPDFYGNVLGAVAVGEHPSSFNHPDRFPKKAAGAPGATLAPGDSIHLFAGCDEVRGIMDKVRLKTSGLPSWSHPAAYLRYDDTTAPFDSLAGIYNFTTFTADTGRVIYLPFSLEAVVDHHRVTCDPPDSPFGNVGLGTYSGHAELLKEALEIFGGSPRTSIAPAGAAAFQDALLPASPNPMRGGGVFRFTLSAPVPVTLAIFDVAGRRVATLVEGAREAGEHTARWSGRDAGGHEMAPGIYFARFTTPRVARTAKFLITR